MVNGLTPSLWKCKKRSTVLRFYITGENSHELKANILKAEQQVAQRILNIITRCKNTCEKFNDPDFGPNKEDEYGAFAMYRDGKVNIYIFFIISLNSKLAPWFYPQIYCMNYNVANLLRQSLTIYNSISNLRIYLVEKVNAILMYNSL